MTGSGFLEFGFGFSQDPRVRKTRGSIKTGKAIYYLRNTQGSNISSNIDTILLFEFIDNTPLACEIILHSSGDLVSKYSLDVGVFYQTQKAPSADTHTGTCGLNRKAIADVGEQKATLAEYALNINSRS